MKANQKFLNRDDEAVSPVIAVILMVAITVVLAATVYVWVSGFGSNSSSPAKSAALTSAGAMSNGWKDYTFASATPGMKYQDFTLSINGATKSQDLTFTSCNTLASTSVYGACHASAPLTSANNLITAGDQISVKGLSGGETLRLVDSASNSIILTLTVS